MKISDILKKQQALLEAPLGSYNLLSGSSGEDFDPSRPSGEGWKRDDERKNVEAAKPEPFFRKSDRKAIHNPKTVETLQKIFARIDFNVHFVFINDRENHQLGNLNDFPEQGRFMMSYISNYDHANFIEKLRNKDINSLIVVFRGNDPDGYEEHISLTPWMMLHRMSHKLSIIFKHIFISDTLHGLGVLLSKVKSSKINRRTDKHLIPYSLFFPMRSARLMKISTDGPIMDEIQRECFTQTLFNPNWTLKPLSEEILSQISPDNVQDVVSYYNAVNRWVEEYKQHVAKVMANASRGTIYL